MWPGSVGYSLCLNLDPNQTGGFVMGFVITSEVFMEASIRFSILATDYDFPTGQRPGRVALPKHSSHRGMRRRSLVGVVVLLALLCFGCCTCYRRRTARLPSNLQASIKVRNASEQAGATPTTPTVGIEVQSAYDAKI